MSFGIGYGADEYAKQSGAILVFKSEVGGGEISFPAFLTDFSQNFTSDWTSERVLGRNDPIATFQGTKRTISLAWDLPSATLKDAKSNLKKCGDLIQFLYPGYTTLGERLPVGPKGGKKASAAAKKNYQKDVQRIKKANRRKPSVMSRAPLIRITYANLITGNASRPPSTKKSDAAKKQKNAGQSDQSNSTDKDKPDSLDDPKGSTSSKKQNSGLAKSLSSVGLLGWVDSLSWKPVLDMGVFNESNSFYPKVISLNLNFNVLHEEFLGWQNKSWMGSKFPFKIN